VLLYGSPVKVLRKAVGEMECLEMDDINEIKTIVANKSIGNGMHVFLIERGIERLKTLLDAPNCRFIILAQTIGHIEPALLSRCCMLRVMPPKRMKGIDPALEKLLGLIKSGKNQLEIVAGIREYCYKTRLELKEVARQIIEICKDHKRICEIIEVCANAEHDAQLSYCPVLCYEKVFVGLWGVLCSRSQKT
jgi:hypothetical protein